MNNCTCTPSCHCPSHVFQLETFTQNRKYLSTGEPLQPFRSPGAQTTACSSIFVAHFQFHFLKTYFFTFTFFFLRLSFLLPLHTKNFLSGAEIWSDATVQCCLPHVTVSALFTTHEHNSFSCYCQSLLLINLW